MIQGYIAEIAIFFSSFPDHFRRDAKKWSSILMQSTNCKGSGKIYAVKKYKSFYKRFKQYIDS